MLRLNLGPIDLRAAEILAERRGISVDDLVSGLIRRESAMVISDLQQELPADSERITRFLVPSSATGRG
jgi:hypothetical protein